MICLDTAFLIDLFRRDEAALEKAASVKQQILHTTEINVFELFLGEFKRKEIRQEKIAGLYAFLEEISVLDLNKESAVKSAQIAAELLKNGESIGHMDSLIAGIALSHGVSTIITRNIKDFSKINGIKVETY